MNPLVAPGNYNITYNEYVRIIEVVGNLASGFIVFCVVVGLAWYFMRNYLRTRSLFAPGVTKVSEDVTGRFDAFITLVDHYESTKLCMKDVDPKYWENHYFVEVRRVMTSLLPFEAVIVTNYCASDIERWFKYKKLLGFPDKDLTQKQG